MSMRCFIPYFLAFVSGSSNYPKLTFQIAICCYFSIRYSQPFGVLNLKLILRPYFHLNTSLGCKTLASQGNFRDCLKEIVAFIFLKYEENYFIPEINYVGTSQTLIGIENKKGSNKTPRQERFSLITKTTSFGQESHSPIDSRSSYLLGKGKSLNEPNEEHLKNYVQNLTTHLVDEVCLYSEKLDYMEQCYWEMNEGKMKEEIELKLKEEKSHISMRSVEGEVLGEEVKYHKIIPVILKNELNLDSGKYGW